MKRVTALASSGIVWTLGFSAVAWLMAEFAVGMAAARLRGNR